MEKLKLQANIWKIYVIGFFTSFNLISAILYLFLDQNGLNFSEMALLGSIFALTMVLFEVPTGYLADIWGRKFALTLGIFCWGLGTLGYAFAYDLNTFLATKILMGIGFAFFSGSNTAMLYDTLVDLKKENLYKNILGNMGFIEMMALTIGAGLGGFLIRYGMHEVFFLNGAVFLIAFLCCFTLYEPVHHKMVVKENYFKNLLMIFKEALYTNKDLSFLIFYGAVLVSLARSLQFIYTPYLMLTGLDIIWIGIVIGFFKFINGLANKYAYRYEQKLGVKFSLLSFIFILGIAYIFMSKVVFLGSFIFVSITTMAHGLRRIVTVDQINKISKSKARATILSIDNLISKLFYTIYVFVFGLLIDAYGILDVMFWVGILALLLGVGLYFLYFKKPQTLSKMV